MELNERLSVLRDAYDRCLKDGKVRSMKDFAELIGINRTTLSAAINGNEQYLTDSLVARAIDAVKSSGDDPIGETIPLVPYAVRGGALQGFSEGVEEYECEKIISPVKGAQLAFEVTGESMAPGYPPGTRVLLRKVQANIAWGEVYVVDSVDGPVLKRILPTDDENVWELRSDNPNYPPFKINVENVRGVWRVLLRMIQ